jgi:proteic killer suppression protein
VIRSFADAVTEQFWRTGRGRRVPSNIRQRALQKLAMLDAANHVTDLESPPGNHLELLKGDMAGLYSIRINEKYRITFRWNSGDAFEVRIVDYH